MQPWAAIITVTLFLVLLYTFYGRSQFYRDPGSVFFDVDRAFERRYSLLREKEVREFLESATSVDGMAEDWSTSTAMSGQKLASPICAVVLTFGENRDAATHPLEV